MFRGIAVEYCPLFDPGAASDSRCSQTDPNAKVYQNNFERTMLAGGDWSLSASRLPELAEVTASRATAAAQQAQRRAKRLRTSKMETAGQAGALSCSGQPIAEVCVSIREGGAPYGNSNSRPSGS